LKEFLKAIDEDPRRLDASSESAHRLVEEIRRMLSGPDGLLDRSAYENVYRALEAVRTDENDKYELYEHYSKPHVIEKKKSARAASNASW